MGCTDTAPCPASVAPSPRFISWGGTPGLGVTYGCSARCPQHKRKYVRMLPCFERIPLALVTSEVRGGSRPEFSYSGFCSSSAIHVQWQTGCNISGCCRCATNCLPTHTHTHTHTHTRTRFDRHSVRDGYKYNRQSSQINCVLHRPFATCQRRFVHGYLLKRLQRFNSSAHY